MDVPSESRIRNCDINDVHVGDEHKWVLESTDLLDAWDVSVNRRGSKYSS
jgi:hypothetical protein